MNIEKISNQISQAMNERMSRGTVIRFGLFLALIGLTGCDLQSDGPRKTNLAVIKQYELLSKYLVDGPELKDGKEMPSPFTGYSLSVAPGVITIPKGMNLRSAPYFPAEANDINTVLACDTQVENAWIVSGVSDTASTIPNPGSFAAFINNGKVEYVSLKGVTYEGRTVAGVNLDTMVACTRVGYDKAKKTIECSHNVTGTDSKVISAGRIITK